MNWLDPEEVRKQYLHIVNPKEAAVEFVKAAAKLEMSDGVHPGGKRPTCFQCHQDEILAVIKLIARRLEGGDEAKLEPMCRGFDPRHARDERGKRLEGGDEG